MSLLEGRKCPDCGGTLMREELPYPRVRCTKEGHLFGHAAVGIYFEQPFREERLAGLEKRALVDVEPFQMSEAGRQIMEGFFGKASGEPGPDDDINQY